MYESVLYLDCNANKWGKFMEINTGRLLSAAYLSGLLLCGLIVAGCSGSDDSAPLNIAPVAVDDNVAVTKGSVAIFDLAANDSDADDGLDLASSEIVATPANGAVVVNANGTVSYTHDDSATVSDQFTYTIRDNSGDASNVANVMVTVSPVNVAPVAVDDSFTVTKGSETVFNLAANDSDADDGLDFSSIEIVVAPANGAVVVNANGTVSYTHNNGSTVSDQFTYTIRDLSGDISNVASVAIKVVTPATIQADIYGSTVVEGADDLEFVIALSSASNKVISVDYETVDKTAIAGDDYSDTNGTVEFSPGETRKFVTVTVLSNASVPTTSKDMQLVLSNPQNVELSNDTGAGTIIDSDAMSTDVAFDKNWGQLGAFTNASKCGTDCHESDYQSGDAIMTFDGKDISPNTQWQHSMMAQAFNDPYWQAAVEDEVDSFPHLAGFIEDTCITCHAPMGRTHAHHTGNNLDTDDYYRFDTAKSEDHSREGVSCTACHQIDPGNLGSSDSFSGGFTIIGDSSDSRYKDIYGPYASPVSNNMNNQTGHTPTESTFISQSALCATCHTLYTPALDPDTGAPSGISFLEQGTYLEWQNSAYATGEAQEKQCQGCHMPEPSAGFATGISAAPGGAPKDRTPYGQHSLVGGNTHMLEILSDYRTELGIEDSTSTAGFNEQIALTKNFLDSAAAVSVSTPTAVGNDLEFTVDVVNNARHKLPTAYPSRRVWLHVVVKDQGGGIFFESGKPDSRGYISTDEARLKADCMSAHKREGFDSSLCYEPHHDVINDESQVAIYETVLGDVNDNITHTLLQAAQYLKDNRIPPAGFTNSKAATIETQTIPDGVVGDNDFNCVNTAEGCGTDTVHYQVDATGKTGPYSVEVSLLYQATQPGFVDGMHNVGDRVNRFKVMYDAVPPTVEVLATTATP